MAHNYLQEARKTPPHRALIPWGGIMPPYIHTVIFHCDNPANVIELRVNFLAKRRPSCLEIKKEEYLL